MSEPTEPTVEDEPEYNNETNNQQGAEEFDEEADEMTRVVSAELREIPADEYPGDQGEGPDAVPPGYSEPEGGA
jgi:hypothetical protein